eukprot:TRINITY_DN8925_c0_g2_i2.p1 TRINITY_DN8925_c0_g2~~TRINITY_DN8925_c0_g2_i2.p1  ORF type:complete len:591 (-),score=93.15 TRINITY_DN8925_c0_g2_i2:70-1773(-)
MMASQSNNGDVVHAAGSVNIEANDDESSNELAPLVIGKKNVSSKFSVDPNREGNTRHSAFVWKLYEAYGFRLLFMGFVSQHMLKGFVNSLIGPATQYLFGSYKVVGPRMQILSGIAGLPWALKPIIGLISDCFPIGGYNKAPYMIISSVVGVIACVVIAKVPQSAMSIQSVVACLFLMALQGSTCDLLTEAKYAEQMQSKPETGPDLMTFVWFGLYGGGLLGTVIVGKVLDHFGAHAVFFIAVIPLALVVVPTFQNYLGEVPQSSEQAAALRARLLEQKEACFLCVVMFICTMILTVLGIAFESVYVNFVAAAVIALLMLASFSLVLRPIIAKVNAFFLIQTSLSFSIGGASFYFFTDGPDMFPHGPHFSMEFYTSVLGTVGSVTSLVGIMIYQRYMRDWRYHKLLIVSNLLLSVMSISDVILFSRLNLRWGLPDHAFVFGSSVFQGIIAQWLWMPGVVILSQLCPSGMEATMYALLAGCHNLGNTIASNCGALVLELLGCTPSGDANEEEKFKNLWIASALSTILPLLTLAALPFLIPDAKQTDKLLDEADRSATSGSLWKRLVGE